ncbi:MAG: tetratricopeptide repeat protein [Verrucomicrobiota bacterium]|nr:tetratricopeptide repeat protein [Verrucomicrobiota bacterium]
MLSYTPFYFYKANVDNYDKIVGDAVLAFTIGETDKALSTLEKFVSDHPNYIDAWRSLAEIFLAIDRLEEAEVACNRALEIDPEDLTSTVSLARILVRKGDINGAEVASSKARVLGWKEELAEESEE